MSQFPPYIAPTKNNKKVFPALNHVNILSDLRTQLINFILRGNETALFSLSTFYESHYVAEKDKDQYTNTVVKELQAMGWKCKVIGNNKNLLISSV